MNLDGGNKETSQIHDDVKMKLESEFGYSKEEAAAVKSILWDMANKEYSIKTKEDCNDYNINEPRLGSDNFFKSCCKID